MLQMSTCAVPNFNGGLEASSDSDDDDKLHIVEEDSLQEPELAKVKDGHDAKATILPHNGSWNGVKEECVSEEEEEEEAAGDEDEAVKDALVDDILQEGDTAIIYPEAPDDEHSPAETGGADENGTPDSSQLHTCPYCSRGYKRNASLKEHIKYRHETSEDNYSCSHCSYTFTYRSQLERHMSHHRGSKEQRHASQSSCGVGGPRKFKCTECSKAFKYKHHLKEHLRIHSGEKPYECSNCKKRFSHSGSYSSHISSKKCVQAVTPNGVAHKAMKMQLPVGNSTTMRVAIAPVRPALKEKPESKPLQEQLPVTQIKSEPDEHPCKPAMAPPAGVANVVTSQPVAAPAALPQGVAMVLPTMGLVPPLNINVNDLQNVLKVAMDGNVLRQVLGTTNGAVLQPQQQIISLPAFVDHDGTTKIIINYSIGPAPATTATTQPMSLFVKNNLPLTPVPPVAAAAPTPTKTDKSPSPKVDLSLVKEEPESMLVTETEPDQQMQKTIKTEMADVPQADGDSTCLLCDNCPENLEALHLLQHHKAANGEAVDSAALDPSFAALLSEAGVTLQEPPVDDLLSLLKSYFASNANPSKEELEKISDSVSIPLDVVRKWFVKMNSGKKSSSDTEESKQTQPPKSHSDFSNQNGERREDAKASSECGSASPSDSSSLSLNANDLVIVKSEPEDPEASDSQAEPLDLSLPKQLTATPEDPPPAKNPPQPLNLTCLRKEQVGGRTVYVATPQTHSAVNIVPASQLPTLVAITGQGTVGCLGALNTSAKRTILIPQLTYTYAATAGNAAKTVVLNGHKTPDTSSDASTAEDQKELKKARLENGIYACDLCSKVFQKGSSLLRHKYEHTGKRPHECPVCKKAFKHKHHLIEHSRLHSGEKPYQCNKCGKRFSHSGSYSQHMNHRYSYCKRDGLSQDVGPMSDSPGPMSHSQLDSDGRESEDDEAMCVDDVRVVQVDDGVCEIYEGNFDDDDEDEDEEDGEEGEEQEQEQEVVQEVEQEVVQDVVKDVVQGEEGERKGKKKEAADMEVDEFACGVVEVELKHDQSLESPEDKEESAGVNLEHMADCAYKNIRDWSDSEESSDEAVTNAK
ncbi:zinc finger E-box-binding homeobox 1-like isoform X2 [Dunckerocampus dactyliophorus]|uniref:zinc finger E-box-binding homeobox 1-like isoform X2 n=1 Tax=Dunckerocampus dactyliophorus TaxID=161453 RepID=UPI0024073A92|nr:zinc finger E-box-binding homeobox 1-like isoform X2 [Dunckerocampus dactyliophorus]